MMTNQYDVIVLSPRAFLCPLITVVAFVLASFVMKFLLFYLYLVLGNVFIYAANSDSKQACGNDEGMCQIYETCCQMTNSTWGCCPYIYANCCTGYNYCCQSGFECNPKGNNCVRMKPDKDSK
ncbi:hypothetical protein L596_013026 [Steinernema carpocapsae]|nr:hypothetical protein L596_013026 [Steinernema carpocapsae]